MAQLDRLLHSKTHLIANRPAVDSVRGKTWVTRRGVKIDRMASAWFIRRFVDRNAQFLFFDSAAYIHSSDQIRFDMFEGEFTHENDMCTFEVLLHWRGVNDPALTALAEVVHDIDIKDGKFQRPEAAGVRSLIEGIALRTSDDMERIEESGVLFDSLYARFRAPK
jgi:hypothetical protein